MKNTGLSKQLAADVRIRELYESGMSSPKIGEFYSTSGTMILKALRAQGTRIRSNSECQRKHDCDHRFFRTIETEQQAYWLGFFTADGCVRPPNIIALGLRMDDRNHVALFGQAVGTTALAKDRAHRKYPVTEIAFRSTEMTADLANLGVLPNKEQITIWPTLPSRLYRHYVRGVIDGDGSFPRPQRKSTRNQACFQIAISLDYAEECQRYLMTTFGFGKTKIEPRGKKRGIYVLRYSGNRQLFPFFHWLYEDATIFLPRKRQLVLDHYRALPKYRDQLRFG